MHASASCPATPRLVSVHAARAAAGLLRRHGDGLLCASVCSPRTVHICCAPCTCAGARLTAFELMHDGLPATLICDSAAAYLMALGKVGPGRQGGDGRVDGRSSPCCCQARGCGGGGCEPRGGSRDDGQGTATVCPQCIHHPCLLVRRWTQWWWARTASWPPETPPTRSARESRRPLLRHAAPPPPPLTPPLRVPRASPARAACCCCCCSLACVLMAATTDCAASAGRANDQPTNHLPATQRRRGLLTVPPCIKWVPASASQRVACTAAPPVLHPHHTQVSHRATSGRRAPACQCALSPH